MKFKPKFYRPLRYYLTLSLFGQGIVLARTTWKGVETMKPGDSVRCTVRVQRVTDDGFFDAANRFWRGDTAFLFAGNQLGLEVEFLSPNLLTLMTDRGQFVSYV